MALQSLVGLQKASRTLRKPQHTFQVRHQAWQIQPFMIAPVLPGETMKNLLLQARAVTQPIKNALIGWWLEYYFFYVKLNDLDGRADFTEMFVDPAKDLSTYQSVTEDVPTYFYGGTAVGSINWVNLLLEKVVTEYFRDEGEAWDDFLIDGLPIASISRQSWLDSVSTDTLMAAQDVDVDIDADTTIMASEVEFAMQQWEFMRQVGLTNASYEDFLATYGVRPKEEELHIPELVRYIREWTYPTNTVDPTDGTPSSACSWSIAERADKDRFFREPGFLFGVTVARPKVYLSKQAGAAASMLEDAYGWLPAVLLNDVRTSLRKFAGETAGAAADAEGPLKNAADDYWVDLRDLFMYGDQFVNFALTETDAGFVALPTAANQKRYAASTDADALFVSGADGLVKQDGVVSLGIASRQVDQTARV